MHGSREVVDFKGYPEVLQQYGGQMFAGYCLSLLCIVHTAGRASMQWSRDRIA
jgi:hypothetical protein